MIGIDTNVLIRYLVEDEPKQAATAAKILEKHSKINKIFINQIVLCEAVWVLLGAYRFSKAQVMAVLEKILMTEDFEIENHQEVWDALADFRSTSADFADCLIGRKNKAAGCEITYSFDKAVKSLSSFNLVS